MPPGRLLLLLSPQQTNANSRQAMPLCGAACSSSQDHSCCSRYALTFLLKAHSFSQSCSVVALLAPCPRIKSFSACSWRPRRKMPYRHNVHHMSIDCKRELNHTTSQRSKDL